MKIAFLFGAGVSIPAGLPSMNQITESLLLGRDIRDGLEFYKHTDDHFYKKRNNSFKLVTEGIKIQNITKFLSRIKPEIEYFLGIRGIDRNASYEDLHFIVSQFDYHYNSEGMNPAIQPFIDKMGKDISHLMIREGERKALKYSLEEFSREAAKYIYDLSLLMLRTPIQDSIKLDHFSFIRDAICDSFVEQTNIFTLNHDKLLEAFFDQCNIAVNDFFENDIDGNLRKWNSNKPIDKINLLKIHGSVDWFADNGNRVTPTKKLYKDDNAYFGFKIHHHRPLVLMGTINKMIEYSSDFWIDLQWMFKNMLSESDFLIVSGYGFGDDIVNSRLLVWLGTKKERKIIIVHAEPENLTNGSLNMLFDELEWSTWTALRNEGRIILIRKWIEDITWKEIKDKIQEIACPNPNSN